MKYLGIDYGTKRIGIAVSDEAGQIAFPKFVWVNDKKVLTSIKSLVSEESIGAIVFGDSVDANGKENALNAGVKDFAEQVKKETHLPIFFEKEFWSSYEAHGRQGKESKNARMQSVAKTEGVDAKAAAVILQRYLDRNFRLKA
jgi:putative Holliday junction resolvase